MKTRISLVLVVIFVAGLFVINTGCEGTVSFTTANITDTVMAKGVDTEKRPVNPTSTFTTDVPEIYCSAKMNNAPADTKVTGKWIYISGEIKDTTNYEIDSATLAIEGTRYFKMSLSKPTNGWPKGSYKLVLLIDGKESVSVPFTIQ